MTQQQQIPLARTSSPYPDYSGNGLERLEPKTVKELDQVDYRARPAMTGDHPNLLEDADQPL